MDSAQLVSAVPLEPTQFMGTNLGQLKENDLEFRADWEDAIGHYCVPQ